MVDKIKLRKLAQVITDYSIEVKPGDKVLLRGYGFDSYPLIKEIYRACVKAGALEIDVRFSTDELSRIFMEEASDKQLKHVRKWDLKVAEDYDCMVQIVSGENSYEMSAVPQDKKQMVMMANKKIRDVLIQKRWCLFYYPNVASAMLAKRNVEEGEEFVIDSCLVDWKKEAKRQEKFIDVVSKVGEVRVRGEDTDLTLSIKGQKWRSCCGKRNLPDGEIFTSPVLKSVNGFIRYNVPTTYNFQDFEWVKLTLKNGKVVGEESDNLKGLTPILNTDPGARYFGEFAFGMNKNITKGTKMILFDEKMDKTLHMALGKCYKEAPNGNDSLIHWDLIFDFKTAKAEIYFDGVKVYGGGKWLDKRLKFLNA